MEGANLDYIDYAQPLKLLVFSSANLPTEVFCQESPNLWLHSETSPCKSVVSYIQAIIALLFKLQKIALETFGKETDQVVTHLSIN